MPTTIDIESQRMLLGTTPVRKIYQGPNLLGTRIAELFANGEQGVWYDPSDLSTLFQDAAGTIPVTGVEQPVGLMLDKSGRGNHASQATTTARPVISARYNRLTRTEDFSHPDWTSSPKFTYENVQAPDGSMTAQRLTSLGLPSVPNKTGTTARTTYVKFTIWLKAGTLISPVTLVRNNTTATNLVQLSFTGSVSNSYGTGVTQQGADGWVKHTITITSGISVGDAIWFYYGWTGGVPLDQTFSVWHPDVRDVSEVVPLPDYQRVTTATDYAAAGFPPYLEFDGIDDLLVTSAVLPATNSATLVVGATKLSLVRGMVVCSGGDPVAALNAYSLELPSASGTTALCRMRGSGTNQVAYVNVPGNISLVACAKLTLSPVLQVLQINGQVAATRAASAGDGPFAAAVLTVGGTSASTVLFKGRLYGVIVVGSMLSSAEVRAAEQYIRNKGKVY